MKGPAVASELPLKPPDLTRSEFLRIREFAQAKFGLDLRDGKERLVAARLGRYLRAGGFSSFDAYLEHVEQDRTGESLVHLINALSTNHTAFFRESRHFEFLQETILPHYAGRTLQIWSAASSTGEEPYSIAMTVLEQPPQCRPRTLRIMASDISTEVLAAARAGVYSRERVEAAPPALQAKYFKHVTADPQSSLQIADVVRTAVEFRRINLTDPVHWGQQFDVIFCRNVMIYFNRATQNQLLRRLAANLLPGGYLMVGHSESLTGLQHPLQYIEPAVYRSPLPRRR